jgi:hypothetical protein
MNLFRPIEIEHEARCAAPPAAAWATLVEIERWPDWYPHVHAVRPVPDIGGAWPQLQEGATWEEEVHRGPFKPRLQATVLELVEGEALTWEARHLGVTGWHTWHVDRTDNGCRLSDRYVFSGPGWRLVAARLLLALFRVKAQGQRQIDAWARRAEKLGPNVE